MTVMAWIDLDSLDPIEAATTAYVIDRIDNNGSAENGWGLAVEDGATISNGIRFLRTFSTAPGAWSSDDVITAGAVYHIAVTYDNNPANDPLIYVNGDSKTVTELFTPSGTPHDDSAKLLWVGSYKFIGGTVYTLDGKAADLRIYNRILTAAEVAEIYNSRSFFSVPYGLVFQCKGNGAAGLQGYDGATLGGTNFLLDNIFGVKGTPSGSPVGRAEIVLTGR